MLLRNLTYLNEQMRFLEADISVEEGRIVSISPSGASLTAPTETLDCRELIAIPGIVLAHFHSQADLGRGLFKGKPPSEWTGDTGPQARLQERFFEYLDNGASEEDFKTICRKGYVELLRQGVTFVQDSGLGERPARARYDAMNEVGLRGLIDAYEEIEELANRADRRVFFGGHLPEEEDVTEEALTTVTRARAAVPDAVFMTHCLETKQRKDLILERAGRSTVRLFEERGLLAGRTVLFHGTEMDEDDIRILAERGVSLVHSPITNIAEAGVVDLCIQAGINVGLGTDFGHTDIWEVMRTAYYLRKKFPQAPDAEEIWRMATTNGARAYGMEDRIGSIAEGYCADIVLIDASDTALLPVVEKDGFSNRAHNLLVWGRPHMVRHVMIGGEWVVRDGNVLTVDGQALDIEYRAVVQRMTSSL